MVSEDSRLAPELMATPLRSSCQFCGKHGARHSSWDSGFWGFNGVAAAASCAGSVAHGIRVGVQGSGIAAGESLFRLVQQLPAAPLPPQQQVPPFPTLSHPFPHFPPHTL